MPSQLRRRPLNLKPLLAASARRAINNARDAVDALHEQMEHRQRLAPVDADDSQGLAGELSRLSREECLRLLRSRKVGRLAYVARAEVPDIVPVNYLVDDADRILVRSGPGPKLQAASRGAVVAFAVDDIDESAHTGWSVVVTARASVIDPACGYDVQPWATGPREHVICLQVHRIDGRRLS